MRISDTPRRPRRPHLPAVAALGMAIAAALAVPSATAVPAEPSTPQPLADVVTTAVALESSLGDAAAGTYLDRTTGRVVVAVTDEAAADQVRAAGLDARIVERSTKELRAVITELDTTVDLTGTAWGIDPSTNQVVLSADDTVTEAEQAELSEAVSRFGDAVRVERVSGELRMNLLGGEAIYNGAVRCSLGFNVSDGTTYYFLTAGHCGDPGSTWAASPTGTPFATMEESSFPGDDYAVARYTSGETPPSAVRLDGGAEQPITSAADPVVGQTVSRSGSTTGVEEGVVTALNATVNYPEGRVSGLIQTTVCAEPGDSGGPLFSESVAHGLTSGGTGNCTTGGTTFYQPVTEPMELFDLDVYTDDGTGAGR
ncbi:S1 family peptidase [Allostreptomyces psammosilenae]|uniref:Streptogrisin D n=1 Tax=Allostreptomyces psammosilenae TaxID=1892865 RepID=A0A852ZQU5_9ACTN|nr:S1 family peptidase [Allostreptomyces psammosilenae]NYI04773.1 streptogrisin D [Allostreptomyces psammosilenae]